METKDVAKDVTKNIKKDFSNFVGLAGVIPLLVFVYVVAGKISNLNIFVGEIGYIVLATIGIFVLGILIGRKMLMSVTLRLIDDNKKILEIQQELIEKNRLAAITETVLTLGDQINNPLLVISGNLELLDVDIKNNDTSGRISNRIETMRSNFRKIHDVTNRLTKITRPELVEIYGDSKMIDLQASS